MGEKLVAARAIQSNGLNLNTRAANKSPPCVSPQLEPSRPVSRPAGLMAGWLASWLTMIQPGYRRRSFVSPMPSASARRAAALG